MLIWRCRRKTLFPFHAFSYHAYLPYMSSHIALNITTSLLLQYRYLVSFHTFSYGAFSYSAYCHYLNAFISYVNVPFLFPSHSPKYSTSLTCLISCLLLRRLVSFCGFSYSAYLHSAPSPTALNFTMRLLL